MSIKEPIFVYDPADLLVFETVSKAERYVEPADAFDSIYFDANGQILNASIEKDTIGIDHTKITENNSPTYDKNVLRRIIEDTLNMSVIQSTN